MSGITCLLSMIDRNGIASDGCSTPAIAERFDQFLIPKALPPQSGFCIQNGFVFAREFALSIATIVFIQATCPCYTWRRNDIRRRLNQSGPDATGAAIDEQLRIGRANGLLRLEPDLSTLRPGQ
jgi:hypothetical protein